MSLIDHTDKWIIKMFKFNERETGGENCAYYPEGIRIENINLQDDELVFGQFKTNKRTYYFTDTSLLIANGEQERIKINEVISTNGSFRSDHKDIDIETLSGKKYKIKISEFPYRIQQLFYQLIETHGSLIQQSSFLGPTRLETFSTDLPIKDLAKFNLSIDPKTVIKSIETRQILYHGELRDNFIYPDQKGTLIVKIRYDKGEIVIFDSQTDGYNGVAVSATGRIQSASSDFKVLDKSITRTIVIFTYSIEDYEFEELMLEMNLKSINEVNNLFGSIAIYTESEGRIELLTEFETQ